MKTVDILFDGPPGPESGRFIEVERDGKSISFGEWLERDDGYWVLRVPYFETKPVFVAWTNTDLTEGRGSTYALAVSESQTTARRLGKGASVMGSDCRVTEEQAVRGGGYWLVPARIHAPTKEDNEKDQKQAERDAAIQKAREAGLTDEDICRLRG